MKPLAFVVDCGAVTGGVALYLPMLVMAWRMGGHIMGMPMDADMGLIVAGFAAAAYGLLPPLTAMRPDLAVAAPEDAPLSGGALAADGCADPRARHRHHEASIAWLHHPRDGRRVSRDPGDRVACAILRADRNGNRLDRVGRRR